MRMSNENDSKDSRDREIGRKKNVGDMLEAGCGEEMQGVRPGTAVKIASTHVLITDPSTGPSAGQSGTRRGAESSHSLSNSTQVHLVNPVNPVNHVENKGLLTQAPSPTRYASFAWKCNDTKKAGDLSAGSVGVGGDSVVIQTGDASALPSSKPIISAPSSHPKVQVQLSSPHPRNSTYPMGSGTDESHIPGRREIQDSGHTQGKSLAENVRTDLVAALGSTRPSYPRQLSSHHPNEGVQNPHCHLQTSFLDPAKCGRVGGSGEHTPLSLQMIKETCTRIPCNELPTKVGLGTGKDVAVSKGTDMSIISSEQVPCQGPPTGTSDLVMVNRTDLGASDGQIPERCSKLNLKNSTSNSVLLPVPSPEHSSAHITSCSPLGPRNVTELGASSYGKGDSVSRSRDLAAVGENGTAEIPSQSSSSSLPSSLSADAQTDTSDLLGSLLIAPPPSSSKNNREQRKRERREKRRDRSQGAALSEGSDGMRTGPRGNPAALLSRNQVNTRAVDSFSTTPGLSNSAQHFIDNASESPGTQGTSTSATECRHSSPTLVEPSPIPAPPNGGPNYNDSIPSNFPDLLNAHFPPPYSTLPPTAERRVLGSGSPQGPLQLPLVSIPAPTPHATHMQIPFPLPLAPPPPPPILVQPPPNSLPPPAQPTIRYHFSPAVRASRRSLRVSRGVSYASEDEPKSCCGMSTSQAVSIRWFIIIIAVIGISCTVAGTALGAAYSNGREHLTLSLLMIGVGVVLLTVSAVAWRLTAQESGLSCRVMLGFSRRSTSRGDGGTEPNRRFVPRLAPTYGRPHHPYAAMMYPDFQYRPPPPSYQASMQEYRLRLLLLERSNPTIAAAAALSSPSTLTMVPPPPAYRPYSGTIRNSGNSRHEPDYSRPPSYRSRSSGNMGLGEPGLRPSLDPSVGHHLRHMMLESPLHSRDPSLLSYLSQQSIADNVSVVSGHALSGAGNGSAAVVTVMQAVSVGMDLSLDMEMFPSNHHSENSDKGTSERHEGGKMEDKGKAERLASNRVAKKGSQDGNLVRIVQTTDSSQVIRRDSVIVTVSGSNHSLWDQQLHHTNNQHNSNHLAHHHSSRVLGVHTGTSINHLHPDTQTNSSCTSQVQILAHL